VGFGLALTAGVLAIAFSIWPIACLRGWGEIALFWGLVGHIAGGFYLTAAYFARRHRPVASPILSFSGLLLMVSGLGSGRLLALADLELWWLAIAFDLLPILLGVLAAGAVHASGARSGASMNRSLPGDGAATPGPPWLRSVDGYGA
jgi:hypothetical protein